MQLYHPTKGLRGIRRVLQQFDEAVLTPWQRDILRHRLALLACYDRNGKNGAATARTCGTSRPYVRRLVAVRTHKGLGGLIPQRSGPKQQRGTALLFSQRCRIESLAASFPDWGHTKLAPSLPFTSASTIYRHLKRKNMLVRDRCPGFFTKPRPRSAWRIAREKLPKDYLIEHPGALVVLDSIVEYVGPRLQKLYIVTCLDLATRIGLAIATTSHSSLPPQRMLAAMKMVLQKDITAVLTDNGSEFLAYFHRACMAEGIHHFFTRPRTPKDNAVCERFNETLERGFYWRTDLTQPVTAINADLVEWLIEYNLLRPHEALGMRPPAVYYFTTFYAPRYEAGVDLRLWNRTARLQFLIFGVALK